MASYAPFFGFPLVKVRGKCIPRTFTSGLIAQHLSSYQDFKGKRI